VVRRQLESLQVKSAADNGMWSLEKGIVKDLPCYGLI
jgi:hypothetical protein